MAREQKDSESGAGSESRAADVSTPEPILLENDGCSGMRLLALSRPTLSELEAQPQVVYVEFAQPPPPELFKMLALPDGRAAPVNAEFIGLIGFLKERMLVKAEPSFPPSAQLTTDRTRFCTLLFSPESPVEDVARALNDRPEVIHAVTGRGLCPPAGPPRNPLGEPLIGHRYGGMLGTNPSNHLDNQWYVFRCRIDQAWAEGGSGKGVVIADIDWGFLTSHQDLQGRIKVKRNTMDWSTNVTQGAYTYCHGTAVLGIAGAANNGMGMAGVAFGAELWALQAGNKPGTMDPAPWWKAIDYVRKRSSKGRPKIVMLEVQTEMSENVEVIPPIRQAIREAIAAGVVVCVAAGNGSRDAGEDAAGRPFPTTGSILVGATIYDERENVLADFSNFGPRVAVYAPGDAAHDLTCSSAADHAYRNRFGGTSGATPKVAGTVALMLEANSRLTPCEIKDILKETGTPIKTDNPNAAGVFLNAELAMLEARRRAS
jgi:subtilisin family serine protease